MDSSVASILHKNKESPLLGAFFLFQMKKIHPWRVEWTSKQKHPKGSRWGVQPPLLRPPPQVKYLQFVESMTQYGVHLRRPYELHGEKGGVAVRTQTQTSRWSLAGRSPWEVWVTCLVSKVLSITLLRALMAVSISAVGVLALYGQRRARRGKRGLGSRGHDRASRLRENGQSDVSGGCSSGTYWRSCQWRPCSCRHTPPHWRSERCRHHSSLRRLERFPLTGTASAGMETSMAEPKKQPTWAMKE